MGSRQSAYLSPLLKAFWVKYSHSREFPNTYYTMYMYQRDKTFCSMIHVMTSIVQVITVSCYKKDFFFKLFACGYSNWYIYNFFSFKNKWRIIHVLYFKYCKGLRSEILNDYLETKLDSIKLKNTSPEYELHIMHWKIW